MNQIIISKTEEGPIWVTSDDDQIGSESIFYDENSEEYRFLIALADFLMLNPSDLITAGEMWQGLDEED